MTRGVSDGRGPRWRLSFRSAERGGNRRIGGLSFSDWMLPRHIESKRCEASYCRDSCGRSCARRRLRGFRGKGQPRMPDGRRERNCAIFRPTSARIAAQDSSLIPGMDCTRACGFLNCSAEPRLESLGLGFLSPLRGNRDDGVRAGGESGDGR